MQGNERGQTLVKVELETCLTLSTTEGHSLEGKISYAHVNKQFGLNSKFNEKFDIWGKNEALYL